MVKTPRARHNRKTREPVTIDLTASESPAEQAAEVFASEAPDVAEDIAQAIEAQEPGESAPRAEEDAAAASASIEDESASESPSSLWDGGKDETPPAEEIVEAGETPPPSSEDYGFREKTPTYSDPEPTRAAPPPPPAPQKRGASSLAAGLVGAAAALAGAWGLQWAGVLPSPNGTSQPTVSLQPVQDELAAVRTELAALKSQPAPDAGGLAASVDQLKTELAQIQSAVQSGGAGDAAAVAALSDKVNALEARLSAAGGGDTGALEGKVSGLEGQITAAAQAAAGAEQRLSTLEQTVSGLTGKVEEAADQPRMALALAATALKSAIDRGGSFAGELDTLSAVAPDAPEIAGLRPYAEKGVPSAAQLIEQVGATAEAMVAASMPTDENAGLFQRLFDSARSAVKVRPVGEVAGEDVGAHVARMEAAVKAGDYARAVAEFDAAPDETAKAAGAAFIDQLKARMAAEKLVNELMAGAMKAS